MAIKLDMCISKDPLCLQGISLALSKNKVTPPGASNSSLASNKPLSGCSTYFSPPIMATGNIGPTPDGFEQEQATPPRASNQLSGLNKPL